MGGGWGEREGGGGGGRCERGENALAFHAAQGINWSLCERQEVRLKHRVAHNLSIMWLVHFKTAQVWVAAHRYHVLHRKRRVECVRLVNLTDQAGNLARAIASKRLPAQHHVAAGGPP